MQLKSASGVEFGSNRDIFFFFKKQESNIQLGPGSGLYVALVGSKEPLGPSEITGSLDYHLGPTRTLDIPFI